MLRRVAMTIRPEEIDPQRARLRDVNEHVARVPRRDELISLLCECASGYCIEQVSMRRSQFEAIQGGGGYVLAPGHRI
ncbi:MAG TPA: hypothetical protein VH281_03600 [Gaiellaceae bacterium]